MQRSRPVFIVGPARSGTTLLYRILLQHSAFRIHAGDKRFSLAESRVFERPENLLSPDPDPTQQPRAYCLHDRNAFAEFRRTAKPIAVWQAWLATPLGQKLQQRMTDGAASMFKLRLNHILMRLYFHHAATARKTGRILEKTPRHMCHIPEILTAFPRAAILLMQRHPVDIYGSLRRRLASETQLTRPDHPSLEWLKIGIEPFCRQYAENTSRGQQAQQCFGENILAIRYE